jgi:hypothetical protein
LDQPQRWKVSLRRGQKSWVVLRHHWHEEPGEEHTMLPLRRGAYQLVIEFAGPKSEFNDADDLCPQRTGFEIKYKGPDSCDKLIAIPIERLYRARMQEPLDAGMQWPQDSNAAKVLQAQYSSSLRDIRRTYQRAFKAMLFLRRFRLSARPAAPFKQSEWGYMLEHQDLFAGASYYRNPAAFTRHNAYFNFNFLPVLDNFYSSQAAQDDRVQPSAKRIQAMFDWWERIFDYTQMRWQARGEREDRAWELFEEAAENQPDDPAQLLRHMGVDLRHDNLVLSYFDSAGEPPSS